MSRDQIPAGNNDSTKVTLGATSESVSMFNHQEGERIKEEEGEASGSGNSDKTASSEVRCSTTAWSLATNHPGGNSTSVGQKGASSKRSRHTGNMPTGVIPCKSRAPNPHLMGGM